jgi:hypothetical protein
MIWNGRETGKWQILHNTKEQYKESFLKLAALGFVFTDDRIKSIDELFHRYDFEFPIIVIGYSGYGDTPTGYRRACKMTLTGFRYRQENEGYDVISVDDWIAKFWPAYDAA